MELVIGQTQTFIEDWKALGFGDDELRSLEAVLLARPEAGPTIANAGGVRKVRFASEGRGKSGAARVVYIYFAAPRHVYLLLAFGKNEQANLSADDKEYCRQIVAKIKANL